MFMIMNKICGCSGGVEIDMYKHFIVVIEAIMTGTQEMKSISCSTSLLCTCEKMIKWTDNILLPP